ncbi:MAG: large subunit ribosomal protein L25 [Planctomycetota bacterium]|jgi:large subunit ribosomal protein L25
MAQSSVLTAQKRARVGSNGSRQLRASGRIPANIQGGDAHIDISIDEREFLATRRAHVHLYDVDIEGTQETAIVNELQWDTFGDHIIHVEFRHVIRGVEIESEVEVTFMGHPAGGVVNHLVEHITISSIPSMIPDSLVAKVDGLAEGDHVKASQIELPDGVTLACDPNLDIASIIGTRSSAETEAAEVEAEEAEDADE